MIRKLWLDVRPVFWLSLVLLLLLTAFYSLFFKTANIFAYAEDHSYGLVIRPHDDVSDLLKEHPTGRLLSLKNTPDTYFFGFDAMTRFVFPFIALFLCVGGILTQKSNGTASFSLSLPLSRPAWLWRRAAMASGLVLGLAVLSCATAFAISWWMGTGHSLGWLITSPLILVVAAAPGIGMSLYVQSWISGRFNNSTAEEIVAFSITLLAVVIINPFSNAAGLDPSMWLFFAYMKGQAGDVWGRAFVTIALFGFGGLVAAIRRFERMDF